MGDLKTFDLKDISDTYDAPIFVESGTFKGDGVEYAKSCDTFDEIHSIEIIDSLVEESRTKFNDDDNITIHHGDSVSVLTELLPKLDKNVIFWLDGHFPGADLHEKGYNDEEDDTKRIPLEYEVGLISERCGKYNDVLIMDDAWLYIDADFDWGSLDEHMKKCGFNVTRKELGGGNGADFIYNNFEETHDIKIYKNHQGYFFVTPKEIENGK